MAARKTVKEKKVKRPPIYVASRRKRKASVKAHPYNRARKKLLKKVKLFFYAAFSIVITVLILTGVSVYKFLNAPFSRASQTNYTDVNTVWKGNETNLLAVKIANIDDPFAEVEEVVIVNFDSFTERYSVYHVPVSVEVNYAFNYGKGPLKRIYAVGNSDQDRGLYLLEETLLRLFAVRMDGYVITDQNGWDEFNRILGHIDQNDLSASLRLRNFTKIPSFYKAVRNETITDLKISDIKKSLGFIRHTSSTSSSIYNLNKYYLFDSNLWDNLWQDRLSISPIKREGVKVFVANASDPKIPGLASWGARVIKNIGADVLEIDNSLSNFSENSIITSDPNLETVKRIQMVLGIDRVYLRNELDSTKTYNSQIQRTKISLILTSF